MLPYVALAVSVLTAAYGVWITLHPPKPRQTWRYWVAFGVLVAAGILVAIWQIREQEAEKWELAAAQVNAEVWQRKSEHWQRRLDSKVDEVGLKLGLADSRQRILELQGQLITQMTAVNTKTAVQEFKASRDTKLKLRAERIEVSRALLDKVEPRYKGLLDTIRGVVAEWLRDHEAEIRYGVPRSDTESFPAITLETRKQGPMIEATFKAGYSLQIWVSSAAVDNGKVAKPLAVYFFGRSLVPNAQQETLWSLGVDEKSATFAHPSDRFQFQHLETQSSNPITDPKFMEGFYSSLNDVMSYVVLEGTTQTEPAAKN